MQNYPEASLKRSQLVPLKIEDCMEPIYNFFRKYIQINAQNQNKNEQFEIEGKIGRVKMREVMYEQTLQSLLYSSRGNFINLTTAIPPEIRRNFESNLDASMFWKCYDYILLCEKFVQKFQSNDSGDNEFSQQIQNNVIFQNMKEYYKDITINIDLEDITLDLIVQDPIDPSNNRRLSYSLLSPVEKKLTLMQKAKDKQENMDIAHNLVQYRISACQETSFTNMSQTYILEYVSTNSKLINLMRIKKRKTITFQFMEIALTQVFQLEKNNQAFQQLLQSLIKQEFNKIDIIIKKFYNKTKPPMPLKIGNNEFYQPIYEIEFEITNQNFLQQQLANSQFFEGCVKRLFRNIESFYRIEYLQQFFGITREFIKFNSKTPMYVQPVIGQYFDKEAQNFVFKKYIKSQLLDEDHDQEVQKQQNSNHNNNKNNIQNNIQSSKNEQNMNNDEDDIL